MPLFRKFGAYFTLFLLLLVVNSCTEDGDVFDPEEVNVWENLGVSRGLASNDVATIYEDNTGGIWVGTFGSGVSRFNGSSYISYNNTSTGGGIPDDNVLSIAQDAAGQIIVGTGFGLGIFSSGQWGSLTQIFGLNLNEVTALYLDNQNSFWIGSSNLGLIEFTGGNFIQYFDTGCLECNFVNYIHEDSNGRLWVGTEGGLRRISGGSEVFYDTTNGLPDNDVRSIFEDSWGNIWVGTLLGENVAVFNGSGFTERSLFNGEPINPVLDITEDNDRNVWFGLIGVGIVVYDGVVGRTLFEDGPGKVTITSLHRDMNGDIWVGTTSSGAWRYITP